MTARNLARESEKAEQGIRRAKVSIVVVWAAILTIAMFAIVAVQRVDVDRANRRLDRLEQTYLPGKAAERDRQFDELRSAYCASTAVHPTAAQSAYRRIFACPASATVPKPKAATSSTKPSASTAPTRPAGTTPPAANAPGTVAPRLSAAPAATPTPGRPFTPAPGRTATVTRSVPAPPASATPPAPTPTHGLCLLGILLC